MVAKERSQVTKRASEIGSDGIGGGMLAAGCWLLQAWVDWTLSDPRACASDLFAPWVRVPRLISRRVTQPGGGELLREISITNARH